MRELFHSGRALYEVTRRGADTCEGTLEWGLPGGLSVVAGCGAERQLDDAEFLNAVTAFPLPSG